MLKSLAKQSLLILMLSTILAANEGYQIFFVPFDIQTDRPITTKTITDDAFVVIKVEHEQMSYKIRRIIKNTQSIHFDKHMVRMKIIDCNDVYFFDNKGNGILNKTQGVFIDPSEFEKFISPKQILIPLRN